MKKTFIIGISIVLVMFIFISNVDEVIADSDLKFVEQSEIVQLRAGGGSSSGGSSGTSGSSRRHSTRTNRGRTGRTTSVIGTILSYIVFGILIFFTSIMLYIKVIRASINSRILLRLLDDKDKMWKYKNIEKQVINAFYSVQESWTNMDMLSSREYLSDSLYEEFNIKLEWMKIGNKRNILKKIRLVNLKPISIHDDEDNSKDLIWFYIKGSMIDYTINTKTNEKLAGNDYAKSFVEFWKFVRTNDDKWVLDKILQNDEQNKIKFQDRIK